MTILILDRLVNSNSIAPCLAKDRNHRGDEEDTKQNEG